jgi:hypothetical protein
MSYGLGVIEGGWPGSKPRERFWVPHARIYERGSFFLFFFLRFATSLGNSGADSAFPAILIFAFELARAGGPGVSRENDSGCPTLGFMSVGLSFDFSFSASQLHWGNSGADSTFPAIFAFALALAWQKIDKRPARRQVYRMSKMREETCFYEYQSRRIH